MRSAWGVNPIWGTSAWNFERKVFIIQLLREHDARAQIVQCPPGMNRPGWFLSSLGLAAVGIILGMSARADAEPTLEVVVPDSGPRVNEPYDVTYVVSWTGAADAYAIMPPSFEGVDWAELTAAAAGVETTGSTHKVLQTLRLIGFEEGEYTIPAVSIAYAPLSSLLGSGASEQAAVELDTAGQSYETLQAEPIPVTVLPEARAWSWAIGIGVIVVLVLAVSGALIVARGRGSRASRESMDGGATLDQALRRAEQSRLDGDFYEFYRHLVDAAGFLPASKERQALVTRLRQTAQDVGYKGVRPRDEEMDGMLKDIERLRHRAQAASMAAAKG